MESDLILFIDIHHQTVFDVSVKWARRAIPIFFDVLEFDPKQRFGIIDDGIEIGCRFYVLVS